MDTSSLLTLRFGLAGLTLLPALQGVGRDVLLAGAEVGVYATMGYMAQAYAMRVSVFVVVVFLILRRMRKNKA